MKSLIMWGAIVLALGMFALAGFSGASIRAGTPGAAVPSVIPIPSQGGDVVAAET
jgi:hypothetical protein